MRTKGERGRRGFTLPELLITIGIFSMAATALAAMGSMFANGQANSMGRTVLENNGSMMGKAIRRALGSASYIQFPTVGVGVTAASLTAWDNVDPDPPYGTLVAGSPRVFSHFCVKNVAAAPPYQAQDNLYLYTGAVLPAITAANCGNAFAGTTRLLVAGGLPGLTIAPQFKRPTNNALEAEYTIRFNRRTGPAPDCSNIAPRMCIKHRMQVNLRGAL